MTNFQSIVKDIEGLRIQGAQNVAKAALKAISLIVAENRNKPEHQLLDLIDHFS